MDLGLSGKVAVVAGSSRGIGRAIAHAFLVEDASVVVTGRDPASLEETESTFRAEFGGERVHSHRGDLAAKRQATALVDTTRERFGPPDCLVLNVGTGRGPGDWHPDEDAWRAGLEVNLWASVRVSEAALPEMLERRDGSIVFIASIAGVEAVEAPLPYGIAKSALIGYSKRLARRLAPEGVRVNCVAPGNVLFPGGSWDEKLRTDPGRWRVYVESEVPVGRFATPEEIAEPVVFLCSERASFVVGACLVADGGQSRSI